MPIKVTCYLILPLRYAGSMSYFICDGAVNHITCVPTQGILVLIADVSEPSIISIFIGRWMKYDRGWDVWCIYT